MLASLQGLDHVVVMTGDLDRAAETWRALGFTVSPRGTHSAHLGTGNYTIMFAADYVELLGVVHETPLNATGREFLQRRGDGIERAAFTTDDAAAGVAALEARGIAAEGPIHFSRPVRREGGGASVASFSVFNWPSDERPGDLRLFACQHHTPGAVWLPELQTHRNTATGIARLEVVARDPVASARRLAHLVDGDARVEEGAARVPTAAGRAEFVFLADAAFRARHPSASGDALPQEGVAALVMRVSDPDAAARALGDAARLEGNSWVVPAARSTGVMLVFEPAEQALRR